MKHDIDRQALLETFALEAAEHIALIEEVLLRLDRDERQSDDIHAMFRAAHTIKGAAACLTLDGVTRFAHVLEDVVERAAFGRIATGPPFVTLLFECVDELRRLVVGGEPDEVLMTRLREIPSEEQDLPRRNELAEGAHRGSRKTLRVEVEKLDAMLTAVGELGIAKGHLAELLAARADQELLQEAERGVTRLWEELQQQLIGIRMLPLATVFKPLSRVVRDVAAKCGKQARLTFEGEDVELDLSVIEQLKDPLVHMLRNAVAHGLETPAERIERGKAAAGSVTLSARYDGGSVLVTMTDDGRGLDRQAILARAKMLGLTEADPELLIFEPGFSTAAAVDDVSGRGMGMDVVRRNLEGIRGSVAVSSCPGEGTTFVLRVPLTLAVIDGFCVAAGGEFFVMPIDGVVECLACPDLQFTAGTAVMGVRDEPVPLLRLDALLSHGVQKPTRTGWRENVVIVRHGTRQAGLVVNEIRGALQTLVRAIPPFFTRNPAVTGSAILGDGRIALILDISTLLTATAQTAAAATQRLEGAVQ